MNGVDRADQMRATNACKRKETVLSIQVWHFLQDICILNAFNVYLKLREMKLIEVKEKDDTEEGNDKEGDGVEKLSTARKLREFKRQLACSLCTPYADIYQQSRKTPKSSRKRGTPSTSGSSVPASAIRMRQLQDNDNIFLVRIGRIIIVRKNLLVLFYHVLDVMLNDLLVDFQKINGLAIRFSVED